VERLRAKLEKNLGSISDMTRLPGAIFVVDTMREHIAVKEAEKLKIPIFAMVDTNSDPKPIDYIIPSNDDASKSIDIIMSQVTQAVAEGLVERKSEKAAEKEGAEPNEKPAKAEASKAVSEPEKEAPAEPVAEETVAEPTEAAVETSKEEVKDTATEEPVADDLTKVEGIGPKTAEALVNAGINTFAILSKANPEKIKELLTEASSRLAHLDPGSWPKQAKMAADGKWDELKEWQEKAKGGVE
jgi:small subunit ribosomal protein S2